jgi:hypothetical protein
MGIGKSIAALAFVGLVGYGGYRLLYNPDFNFKGKIEDKVVSLYEPFLSYKNVMDIQTEDGIHIKFIDLGKNLTVDFVEVQYGKSFARFSADSENPEVKKNIAKAQKDFDRNLAAILGLQSKPVKK